MTRCEHIGEATLYCGDCLEILPSLGKVDAVIMDPPYGVDFTGKRGHYRNEPQFKKHDTYAATEDTIDEFDRVVLPALRRCIETTDRVLCFMADKNIFRLPIGGSIGGIYLPNGCGMTAWGFQNFMHCVMYGRDPYLAAGAGSRPNGKYGLYGNDANQIDHPCAKPIEAMLWAVGRGTLEGMTVLDPFMGSGTTGVAALRLGRKFIGVEIEPKYFDIACKRIDREVRQGNLFKPPAKAVQGKLV